MPLVRFSVLTFLGCLPWSFALAWAGLLLGDNWEELLPYLEPISYAIAGIVAVVIGVWFFRRYRKQKLAQVQDDVAETSGPEI